MSLFQIHFVQDQAWREKEYQPRMYGMEAEREKRSKRMEIDV